MSSHNSPTHFKTPSKPDRLAVKAAARTLIDSVADLRDVVEIIVTRTGVHLRFSDNSLAERFVELP